MAGQGCWARVLRQAMHNEQLRAQGRGPERGSRSFQITLQPAAGLSPPFLPLPPLMCVKRGASPGIARWYHARSILQQHPTATRFAQLGDALPAPSQRSRPAAAMCASSVKPEADSCSAGVV